MFAVSSIYLERVLFLLAHITTQEKTLRTKGFFKPENFPTGSHAETWTTITPVMQAVILRFHNRVG